MPSFDPKPPTEIEPTSVGQFASVIEIIGLMGGCSIIVLVKFKTHPAKSTIEIL